MFEAQRRRNLNLKNINSPSHSQSLCGYLMEELEKSQQTLRNLKLKLQANISDKQRKLQEIKALKSEFLESGSNLKCTNIIIQNKISYRNTALHIEFSSAYSIANKTKKKITKKLNIERI